jgi:hypothetical protein
MATKSYSISLEQDHLIVKTPGKAPDFVYVASKTRVQVTKDVMWYLRNVTDAEFNKDRVQAQLDQMIWNHVPKRNWY